MQNTSPRAQSFYYVNSETSNPEGCGFEAEGRTSVPFHFSAGRGVEGEGADTLLLLEVSLLCPEWFSTSRDRDMKVNAEKWKALYLFF